MNTQLPLWQYAALIPVAAALSFVHGWIRDRWEITRGRPRVRRRWYGTLAHVCLRSEQDDDDPRRYAVIAWDGDHTAVPWLLLHRLAKDHITAWDERAEAFWAPVTDFAPYTVRRFRPHVDRFGRWPLPWLTRYLPPRDPVAYLEAASDAA